MTRYSPSRNYISAGLVAVGLAAFSGWCALSWTPAVIAGVLFLISASLLIFLALRPPIEIHPHNLRIGSRAIPWAQIRRLDRTGWVSPLILHLSLADESRILVIYPGDLDSSNSLLRHLRRFSTEALIDGVPHRQFWGEPLAPGLERKQIPAPRYPLLREEDEAEVERLYQRLKTVGHLDPKSSQEEK